MPPNFAPVEFVGVGAGCFVNIDEAEMTNLDICLEGDSSLPPQNIVAPLEHLRPSSSLFGPFPPTHGPYPRRAIPARADRSPSPAPSEPNVSSNSSWTSTPSELDPMCRYHVEVHRHERIALSLPTQGRLSPPPAPLLDAPQRAAAGGSSGSAVSSGGCRRDHPLLLRYCADYQPHEQLALQLRRAPPSSMAPATHASGEECRSSSISLCSSSWSERNLVKGEGSNGEGRHLDLVISVRDALRILKAAKRHRDARVQRAIRLRKGKDNTAGKRS